MKNSQLIKLNTIRELAGDAHVLDAIIFELIRTNSDFVDDLVDLMHKDLAEAGYDDEDFEDICSKL